MIPSFNMSAGSWCKINTAVYSQFKRYCNNLVTMIMVSYIFPFVSHLSVVGNWNLKNTRYQVYSGRHPRKQRDRPVVCKAPSGAKVHIPDQSNQINQPLKCLARLKVMNEKDEDKKLN